MKRLLVILLIISLGCACKKSGTRGVIPSTLGELETIPLAKILIEKGFIGTSKDLSINMPPAGFQDRKASCVAFAIAYDVISYNEKVANNYSYDVQNDIPNSNKVFSASFIYNYIKSTDGISDCSTGIKFVTAIKFVEQNGICKLSDFAYSGSSVTCDAPPGPNELNKAKKYNYYKFYRLNHKLDELITVLNDRVPIMFTTTISRDLDIDGYNFFKKGLDYRTKNLFIWNPSVNDIDDLHAMVIVGYDNKKSLFKVMNSWDHDWGNNGYYFIPYSIFFKRAIELYICQANSNTKDLFSLHSKIKIQTLDSATFGTEDSVIKSKIAANIRILEQIHNKTENQNTLLANLKTLY